MFCFVFLSADVVAFDFLGHGDSPAPNTPALYTANEVRYIISILFVVILKLILIIIRVYLMYNLHTLITRTEYQGFIQRGSALGFSTLHSSAIKLMLMSV